MKCLLPFSYIYALVTDCRNWLFDHGWLQEREFRTPTICLGNLSVGGTGKTPFTEFLADWLQTEGKTIATLSRGYGRKTKGYRLVTNAQTAEEVGDEPLQMFRHFSGKIAVAVCEDRCKGIETLEAEIHPDIILLDDAFQHRYVKPTVRILLTDFSRPYFQDEVLPAGRLREGRKGARRADIIVVTKCPENLSKAAAEDFIQRLELQPDQRVFFSSIYYKELPVESAELRKKSLSLLTGIANPSPLIDYFRKMGVTFQQHLRFRDHHRFVPTDIQKIEMAAQQSDYIVTTAKDFARLKDSDLSHEAQSKILIQDIYLRILFDAENDLKTSILGGFYKLAFSDFRILVE